jgi:hypothetical protein
MEINGNMNSNDLAKAGKLLAFGGEIGMDLSGYGILDVNLASGNVYMWLEDYNFCLFIGLGSPSIKARYSCPIDGEESIKERVYSLQDVEMWSSKRAKESEAKENAA